MLYRLSFILLLICETLCAHAQKEKAELNSLVGALQRAYDTNSDSLEYYYKSALELAIRQNDVDNEIKARRTYGIKLFLNGQSDTAATILLDGLRKAEKLPPTAALSMLYYAIAQVYSKNKYPQVSRGYLLSGINVAISIKNHSALADGYNRLGIDYERNNLLDSALYFYESALHVNEKDSTLKLGEAYSLENVAGIYMQRKDPATALAYMKKAVQIKANVGKKLDLILAYINIAETYGELKQYDSAIAYAQKTLIGARELNYKDLESYVNGFLAGIYEIKGDYKKALDFHKTYSTLKDSILTETKTRQLAEADKKFETEKKEKRILDLSQRATIQNLKIKQRSILLYLIIGLFVVAAVVAYLFYNRKKLKAEARLQAEINKQQSITTREILNAEEKERKRIAADLHDGVGQLLSASLMNLNAFFAKNNIDKNANADADRVMRLVTESYDELRSISHQMMPKALAKSGLESAVQELVSGIEPDKLSVSFECSGLGSRLDEEIESVLYRVIQESVNNVIKHANAQKLDIQIHKDEDGISVTIEDDGKGFDPKTLKKTGIGLKNIYSRVQLQNGSVDIDSQPGKGTLVAIHMPTY